MPFLHLFALDHYLFVIIPFSSIIMLLPPGPVCPATIRNHRWSSAVPPPARVPETAPGAPGGRPGIPYSSSAIYVLPFPSHAVARNTPAQLHVFTQLAADPHPHSQISPLPSTTKGPCTRCSRSTSPSNATALDHRHSSARLPPLLPSPGPSILLHVLQTHPVVLHASLLRHTYNIDEATSPVLRRPPPTTYRPPCLPRFLLIRTSPWA